MDGFACCDREDCNPVASVVEILGKQVGSSHLAIKATGSLQRSYGEGNRAQQLQRQWNVSGPRSFSVYHFDAVCRIHDEDQGRYS